MKTKSGWSEISNCGVRIRTKQLRAAPGRGRVTVRCVVPVDAVVVRSLDEPDVTGVAGPDEPGHLDPGVGPEQRPFVGQQFVHDVGRFLRRAGRDPRRTRDLHPPRGARCHPVEARSRWPRRAEDCRERS